MIGVEGIAEWVGREVVDRDGEKVGKLADVYYETTTDEATFVEVRMGAFGRAHGVAPLVGATLSRDYVRLDAHRDAIKGAPQDASGGRLTGEDATAVLAHYGLPADPELEGEARVCFQTRGAAEETERKRAEVAAEATRSAADAGAGAAATAEPAFAPPVAEEPLVASRETEPDRTPDTSVLLARIEQLERRVAALESRA